MPKVLEGSARELILNIKKFCEEEKKAKALLIPLRNVRARVAALAGISEKTVSRIVKEGKIAAVTSSRLVTPGKKRPHPKRIVLDSVNLRFVQQKIHHYYVNNKEMPSINKLRLELASEIDFKGSNTTLRRILKGIGFKFKPVNIKNESKKVFKKSAQIKEVLQPLPEPNYSVYMREVPENIPVPIIPQSQSMVMPTMQNEAMLSNMQHEPSLLRYHLNQ